MSYHFTFDLSTLSKALFFEITNYTERELIPESINEKAKELVKKFNIVEKTGLHIEDAIVLIKDLIETHIRNFMLKTQFIHAKKKALFLPHCCRKYMDARCKAVFNSEYSSYSCQHCSEDCLVHQAIGIASDKAYDVYVLPGGSCVQKILSKQSYEGIVGVACTDELKLGTKILSECMMASQCIPLTKNGCSETQFNIDMLEEILEEKDSER
jgi:hypothetical protein